MCRMPWKSGNLNLLEPSGPHRACYGTAFTGRRMVMSRCYILVHKFGCWLGTRDDVVGWDTAGSIPDGVMGNAPGVDDSATNINEYQEYFLGRGRGGVKAAGAYGWQTTPHVMIVMKCGSLNLLEPWRPVQPYRDCCGFLQALSQNYEKRLLSSSCPSVRPHGTVRLFV